MADYQRVVEYLRDIRGSIATGTLIVNDELRQAATQFAQLCNTANERLRQCSAFLSQGLRSEALHLADENPNLLDLVAALDLPDAAQWAEFCQLNELPIPPMLQMDRAQQLNEAYATDQPMEALLNRHRLLALARAPVRDRLETLRQIQAADPGNVNWDKDVRVFEKARLKQLPGVFYNAMKRKDVAVIVALQTEVNGNAWLEAPPSDLSTALSEAFRRVQRAGADEQLRPLVPQLRDAFAARDYAGCAAVIARWKSIMESAEITTVASDLAGEIQPVVEWMRQEDELSAHRKRFDRACEALTQLLDSNASETDLEAAHARAAGFNEPFPPELQQRYDDRIASIHKTHERAHRTRLITIAAAVVVLLGIAGGLIFYMAQSNKARDWAARIAKAADDADKDFTKLQGAINLRDEQTKSEPGLNNNATVKAAREEVERLVQKKDRLQRIMDETEASLKAGKDAAAKAATLSPAEVLAAAAEIQKSLANPEDVSWLDIGNKIPPLRNDLTSMQTELVNGANAAIRRQAEAIAIEVAAAAPDQFEAAAAKLGGLRVAGISADTENTIKKIETEIAKRRDNLGNASKLTQAMDAIRDGSDTSEHLKAAIDNFITLYPESELAGEFRTANASIPVARAVENYRNMLKGWILSNPSRPAALIPTSNVSTIMTKRFGEMTEYLKANPNSPMLGTLVEYKANVDIMLAAVNTKGSAWLTNYGDILNNPLICDLSYIETSKKNRYYTIETPKITVNGFGGSQKFSFKAMNPKKPQDVMTVEVVAPETLVNEGKPTLTPHADFTRTLKDELKTINTTNWDTFGVDKIEKLVASKDMEPVVRAILILHTLESTNKTLGPLVKGIYDDSIDGLSALKVDEIKFWDPEEKLSPTMTASIAAAIAKIPNSATVRAQITENKTAIFKALTFMPDNSGVLLRDTSGPRIDTKAGAADGSVAYAVVAPAPLTAEAAASAPAGDFPPAGVNPGKLVRIGQRVEGKWKFDGEVTAPSGTMVFIVSPSTATP